MDIPTAYGETAFDMTFECCARRDVPPNVAACMVKDLMACLLEFNLEGVRSAPVSLYRALLQGGEHSPMLFIEVLTDILSPVWAMAQTHEWGVRLDGLFIPFFVFAGNIWITWHCTGAYGGSIYQCSPCSGAWWIQIASGSRRVDYFN